MKQRISRWLALSGSDRIALTGMLLALPIVSVLLGAFGAVRTRRWLERTSARGPGRRADKQDIQAADKLARFAEIAGRRGAITATCLRQSLLVYWLLRRRGLAPRLMLGVRTVESKLEAHAWIELQSVAIGQSDLVHSPFANSDWPTRSVR